MATSLTSFTSLTSLSFQVIFDFCQAGSREAAAEPIPHPGLSKPRLLGSGWQVVVRAEFQEPQKNLHEDR